MHLLNIWRIFTYWNQSTGEGSGTFLIEENFVSASQLEQYVGFLSEISVEKLSLHPAAEL